MMKQTFFVKYFTMLIILALTLTGCWDRTEINDLAVVLSTAVDLEENGDYRVTVQIPLPGQLGGASGGGGGTGGEKPYYIDSETGKTLRAAKGKLQERMSRKILLSHRRVMLISEDVAKEGLSTVFDDISRSPESRLATYLLVSEGKAYELMNAQPKLERFSAEFVRELAKSNQFIDINMKDLAQIVGISGIDSFVPFIKMKKTEGSDDPSEEIQTAGYAIFKNGKMAGVTNERESQGLSYLKNTFKPTYITVEMDKDQYTTVQIITGQTKIEPILDKENAHFDIEVELQARILENHTELNYRELEDILKLDKKLNNHIEQSMEAALKLMRDKQSDLIGLGLMIHRTHPDKWRNKYQHDWHTRFEASTADITVTTTMLTPGLIFQNFTEEGK
jgi:spore germination protein KC